jgi:hypothetical protein
MMIVVFWDIETQFLPHSKNITSALQRFEVFKAMTTKNVVFWYI